ncbi:Aldehyde dehydrogenase family 3 member H1 [Cucurbita argyrosperma subsp. argyrosperma]|nr:Aldehyde dehydrogenase family 3 member H1 [Cucurbita argyrosperma subsp. argyrosperma]
MIKFLARLCMVGEKDKSKLQIAPTLLVDVPRELSDYDGGDIWSLTSHSHVDKVEDSFEVVNSGSKPTCSIFYLPTIRSSRKRFVACISAGAIGINDTALQLSVNTLPFGGVGESGMGAYHGEVLHLIH